MPWLPGRVSVVPGMSLILPVPRCPGCSANQPGGHRRGLGSLCKAVFRQGLLELVASLDFPSPPRDLVNIELQR